jgi:hypothetical protein
MLKVLCVVVMVLVKVIESAADAEIFVVVSERVCL